MYTFGEFESATSRFPVEMSTSTPSNDPTTLCEEGYVLLESGRFEEAYLLLERARELAPANALIHYRLGLLYSDTGRPEQALGALDIAAALNPDDPRIHNNRGSVLQLLGRIAEAEAAYRKALELAPHLELPYLNLGKVLEQQGKTQRAVELYESAIQRGLDAALFGHYLAAAAGRPMSTRAPDRYVRETFDNFAPLFDAKLRELGYDAPRQLAALVEAVADAPLDIVDLGCGTGQCGAALAQRKRRLTGVDLSEKMLAFARGRGVYDDLVATDIHGWLASAPTDAFDLVIAADVFIYIGALDDVFADVCRIVRRHGWFAFSIEDSDDADFTLKASGRYGQSTRYIDRLAANRFVIRQARPAVIRMEAGQPLAGHLYLLQRA